MKVIICLTLSVVLMPFTCAGFIYRLAATAMRVGIDLADDLMHWTDR